MHQQHRVRALVLPCQRQEFVRGSKKKYVKVWPILNNTWLVKIDTNLSKKEVLALKDANFQMQQREDLPPHV